MSYSLFVSVIFSVLSLFYMFLYDQGESSYVINRLSHSGRGDIQFYRSHDDILETLQTRLITSINIYHHV